ncbi:MAG: transposase [Bacteroidales bacterium]|jgi:hypothetical protein|nr:transposase [Bacteroidales bacterium]
MGKIFKDDISGPELERLFSDDGSCYEFLAGLKWGNGFICRKCGNTNSCPGKTPSSRRCTKCKSEESAAAGTIFHNCKFPIHKAFYIAWNVCRGNTAISSWEFARRLALRQMTCWNFKTKIENALETMENLSVTEKKSIEKILMK